jgi:hypothetical protein
MHAFRHWPIAALVLMAVLLILPLWCVVSPAMPDYPAHLAGFHLIRGGAKTLPLSQFYAVHWHLVPNLASEILVPLFAKVLPLEAAVKLFLSLAVAMWVTGAALIQRAITGKFGVAPLAGALFATNANFTWGFFNYTFASGLAFLIFAAWIATRDRPLLLRLVGFALAILVLYVCHLFGACVLAMLIGLYELGALLRKRERDWQVWAFRLGIAIAIFLPVAFLFLFFKSAGGEGGGVEFNYADTIGDRFGSAAQWAFSDPAYLVIGGLAILILAGLAYGKMRLHPAMKLVVLAAAALTLLAPEWALGGWGVDMRLPPVLGVITFASLELRAGKWLTGIFGAGIVALAGANATALIHSWRGFDAQYGEFRTAAQALPPGAKLFTVLDGDALSDTSDPPFWHMAEFAITDRGAFTPLMFATKGQHVIEVKAPYDALAAATAQQGSPPDVTELTDLSLGRTADDPDIDEVYPYLKFFQCHFDYAVVVHGGGTQADVPSFMRLVKAGSFFSLYKIKPTRLCATL